MCLCNVHVHERNINCYTINGDPMSLTHRAQHDHQKIIVNLSH